MLIISIEIMKIVDERETRTARKKRKKKKKKKKKQKRARVNRGYSERFRAK